MSSQLANETKTHEREMHFKQIMLERGLSGKLDVISFSVFVRTLQQTACRAVSSAIQARDPISECLPPKFANEGGTNAKRANSTSDGQAPSDLRLLEIVLYKGL